jgi:hypothetical protein
MVGRYSKRAVVGGGGLIVGVAMLALVASEAVSQAPPPTKLFESSEFRYAVALPDGCRHDEGPGTIDAVCSPGLDAAKSAEASAAASLVLEVGAEVVEEDAGKPIETLAQGYAESTFKDELPEAICGEPDKARVKVENVTRALDTDRVVYTADVVCPEIKFLALGERRAIARFLIMPGRRFRLMARAPKDEFEQNKPAIDAFLASFRVLPADK